MYHYGMTMEFPHAVGCFMGTPVPAVDATGFGYGGRAPERIRPVAWITLKHAPADSSRHGNFISLDDAHDPTHDLRTITSPEPVVPSPAALSCDAWS